MIEGRSLRFIHKADKQLQCVRFKFSLVAGLIIEGLLLLCFIPDILISKGYITSRRVTHLGLQREG